MPETPAGSTGLSALADLIADRKASVCVMGLGYVGLPLTEALLQAGFPVLGMDVDLQKLDQIRTGRVTAYSVNPCGLMEALERGQLQIGSTADLLDRADVVVICVPTPLSKYRDPDLSYVMQAADMVAEHLHPSTLVILESTTYPGTTREVLFGRLEARGWRVGRDYALAYSPERIDPGNPSYRLRNTPKVVGGMTPLCTELAGLFYRQFVDEVIEVRSPEAAEMTKLLENIFRAINIGLVNELAVVCEKLGIDVWEVIDAAATKPFGFMKFYPGPGLGGHCIPIDPLYLSWRMRSLNTMVRFIDLADEVNRQMPYHVARQILLCLNEHQRSVKGSDILLLGVTYKPDVADVRESPANDVARYLMQWGARLTYHDPYVDDWLPYDCPVERLSIDDPRDVAWRSLEAFDLVVVLTDHRWYDYPTLVAHSRLIYDCRNAFQRRGISPRWPGQIWRLGAPGGIGIS